MVDIPSGNLTWLWKITIFNEKIHYKWQFSIAMLVYQRVMPRESQCPGPNCVRFCKRFNESSFLRLGALMFLEPLVACRKRLKSNWTFYNWAGPNFAPKISLLILAQTNNIYIYTHTINQEHQKPVVEITTHKKSGFIQSVWWKNQRKNHEKSSFFTIVFAIEACGIGWKSRRATPAGPPSFASLCGRSGSVPQALPAPKLDSCSGPRGAYDWPGEPSSVWSF